MRIIVFADSHGNVRNVREIFSRNEDVNTFIFLGDGEKDVDRIRECYPDKTILEVCGNCDYGVKTPDIDILMACGKKILYTHGHKWGVKISPNKLFYKAKETGADIVLYAHTHSRYYEYHEGVHLLNPGSAGNPRDGKSPCYAFVDITKAGIVCNHVDI